MELGEAAGRLFMFIRSNFRFNLFRCYSSLCCEFDSCEIHANDIDTDAFYLTECGTRIALDYCVQ